MSRDLRGLVNPGFEEIHITPSRNKVARFKKFTLFGQPFRSLITELIRFQRRMTAGSLSHYEAGLCHVDCVVWQSRTLSVLKSISRALDFQNQHLIREVRFKNHLCAFGED